MVHAERRPSRPASTLRRVSSLAIAATLLLVAVAIASVTRPAGAATASLIKFPFASGSAWSVMQGYNTSPVDGGSHYNCDPNTLKDMPSHTESCGAQYQYKYALDLVRADGNTAGQPVYSPVNGTIRWIDDSTGGMSIYMGTVSGTDYAFAFFHVNLSAGLAAGQAVAQGQLLGTIAPAGQKSNGGTPHIHITIWQTADQGNWSRIAVPFTGLVTIDGYDFPDKGANSKNQYAGASVTSSNTPAAPSPTPTSTATQVAPAGGVPAAPTLTSPANGTTYQNTGITVTFTWSAVSGATQYQVSLDGDLSPWVTGTSWTSGPLSATGQYAWKVQAKNASGVGPWSPMIVFWIDPTNGTGCTQSGTPPSATTPSLAADSTAYNVTDCAVLTGMGFQANEAVNVYLDSASTTPIATVNAASNGSFYTTYLFPDTPGGGHSFIAKGVKSAKQASASFRVAPTIRRDPFSGAVGDNLQITGRGFGAYETVNVTFYLDGNDSVPYSLGSFATNGNGTGSFTTTFPAAAGGLHDYNGKGATTNLLAWGAMQINRTVGVSPTSGGPGATITLTASGFPASTAVTAKWNGSTGATVCSGTTQSNGNFSCTFPIPAGTLAGAYPVALTTAAGTSSSAQVTVAGSAAITISTSSGRAGSKINIAGGGFKANSTVNLTWDAASWVTLTTNSGGAFSYAATAPNIGLGAHTLKATGTSPGGSSIGPSAIFTITTTGGDTGSRMTAPGTFAVTGTIEGLVGGTTSNGHKITPYDHFVSLPSCTGTSCPTWSTGPATACGNACYVRVTNPATGLCSVAPVYDVGPWFTNDNWWDPANLREINTHSQDPQSPSPNYLVQGYPAAEANLDGLDVGYGPGISNVGYLTGNRAAIDIADGTWVDIGLDQNAGIAPVAVTMLWQTGENYQSAMIACGQTIPGGKATITASATVAKVGSSVTISGTGFKANETVSIRLDSSTGAVLGSATASNTGAVSVRITVPAAGYGSHTLYANGSGGSAATTTLSIMSMMTSSGSSTVGGSLTVTGTGFTPNATVSLRMDSTSAPVFTTTQASALGSIRLQVSLPPAVGGSHRLYGTTGTSSAYASIRVIPGVALSSTSGGSYARITVNISGFRASEVVTFAWPDGRTQGSATTDVNGSASFAVRTYHINGPALGTAKGGTSGWSATATYTVVQSISVSPASGAPGSSVTVHGRGWGRSMVVTVYFNRTASSAGTTFCSATTNSIGDFNCAGTIPASAKSGIYPVMAGGGSLIANSQLTVAGPTATATATASATLSPASGDAYTSVTVSVAGFGANEVVKLNWDSAVWGLDSTTVGQAATDAKGAATFVVRSRQANGVWTGKIVGQTSKRVATATFTVVQKITASASSGASGATVTINGTGWLKAQTATITLNAAGSSSGVVFCTSSKTGTTGAFSCTATIPSGLKPGTYSFVAAMGSLSANTPFTVTGITTKAASVATPSATATTSPIADATPGASPTAEATPAASPAAEATPTTSPTAEVTPTETTTATPAPAESATPAPTETPTKTATPEPATETPTPAPTKTPAPVITTLQSIAAVSAAAPSDAATPVAVIPADPSVELLAGGPNGAVAAISFDVKSIGAGKVLSAKLVLTGGGDGSGVSNPVTVLPGYAVDESIVDPSALPLGQAVPAGSIDGAPAQYTSNPGVESALDVTGSITRDGVITFFVTGTPDQLLAISGRSSAAPPRLEIVVQPASQP